jgi:lipoprotein-anchoring transpeptidase ErfK/SrfK
MKRLLLVTIFLLDTFLAGWANPAFPAYAATSAQAQEQTSPAVLCLPGIYLYDPGDCKPAGPSTYLNQMAEKGIAFPIAPLPAAMPDPALAEVNVRYGEVTNRNAPVYGSVEDAIKGNKKAAVQTINGDFVFISYTNEYETSGKRLYEISPGQWMKAADVSRIGVLPRFQGLTFSRTPPNAFGWVLTYFAPAPQIETKRTPGSQSNDYTGHLLNLNEVVQVYAEEQVGEEIWYMIGPDEWVLQKYIARVTPNTIPPAGVTGDRWIEVNLFEQTLAVYDQRQLVFATVVATGAEPFWTQPGVFQIYDKKETTPMTGASEADRSDAYYLEDVPWTMYYDGARALHGAYWRAKMGFRQSHGCINLTVGDAHWLFNWAQLNDWVYVWDPSGQTPTDPNLYTSGAY